MNKPDVSAVAAMQGRELDALLHERLFGKSHTKDFVKALRAVGNVGNLKQVPEYSTEHGPAFFAMVEKVRQSGRPGGRWSICVTTDQRNTGTSALTTRSSGRLRPSVTPCLSPSPAPRC